MARTRAARRMRQRFLWALRWSRYLRQRDRLKALCVAVGVLLVAALVLVLFANQGVSRGILALELAGDADSALAMIGDGREPLTSAEISVIYRALWWDVPGIVLYTVGLVAAALILVPAFRLKRLRDKAVLPIMAVAAFPGVLDLIEDLALAVGVTWPADPWFWIATACALTKIILLLAVLTTLVMAFGSAVSTPDWLRKRMFSPPRRKTDSAAEEASGLGISLSGGGVRAATYSLGTLQTLEQTDHPIGWGEADRITSVSGGSYMAGAWALGREKAGTADSWRARLDGGTGPEETHLLNNLGYLTSAYPRGLPTEPGAPPVFDTEGSRMLTERVRNRPAFWATILAGFLANAVVIAAVLVVVVIPIAWGLRGLASLGTPPCAADVADASDAALCLVQAPRSWVTPVVWAGVWLVVSICWVLVGKLLRHRIRLLKVAKYTVIGSLAMAAATTSLLIVFPLLIAGLARLPDSAALVAAIGAAAGTIGAIARMLRKVLVSIAPILGGVAFLVLILIASAALAKAVWFAPSLLAPAIVLVVAGALVVASWIWASPELWSMFAFYRGRLRSAYALRRTAAGNAVPYANDPDAADDPQVCREPELGYKSRLIICASAHATTKGIRTHYRIPALSFTFSSEEVTMFVPIDDQGKTERYFCTLEEMCAAYPGAGIELASDRITTMFAVALSGAAVSPAMGRFRIGPTSALLAFANIRLGAWLPNPRYASLGDDEEAQREKFPRIRLGYLFKEFLGIHDPTDAFVYVSDGGHWENSGVVELLRQTMPREIVMVDADAGRAETIHQLSQAIDLAKLECDIDVFVDLEPLRGYPSPEGGPVFAQQSVTVGAARRRRPGEGDRWGLLWYTKPILTTNTPTPLLAHREIDSEFPATSTLDQFFDTSTYLAYRNLGRYNAEQIHEARDRLRSALTPRGSLDEFLRAAAQSDAHWVQRTFAGLLRQQPIPDRQQLFDQVAVQLGSP